MVIEDSRADVYLIREALKAAGVDLEISVIQDGDRAVRTIAELDGDDHLRLPDLIILDLNLPRRHGAEVLERLRSSRRCPEIKVVVVTSSDSERDRAEMAKYGVRAYFRKPSDFDHFLELGALVRDLLLEKGFGPLPDGEQH